MKKLFGIVTIIVLLFSILTGCGKEEAAGTEASPAAASPAATDTPAASPAATDAPAASPAATDAPDEVVAAVDITDYPVMWCQEIPLHSDYYPVELVVQTYDRTLVLGTMWTGYRIIDDTHIEYFTRYRFNDDFDTSMMLTSKYGESVLDDLNVTKINDREEEKIEITYTYELNGTELIITTGDMFGEPVTVTYQFSPDFTSLGEYTYRTDF